MKQLIFAICFVFVCNTLFAQIIFKTQNPNIGFGKATNSITNIYMDFVVNGPLVEADGSPVGGYIDNGVTMKAWTSPEIGGGNFAIDNGVFGLGIDGKLYMVSNNEKQSLPQMKWAFQNGPILVKNSLNVRGTSQNKVPRSGIGFTKDGALVVIVSLSPVTFYEFAQLFVNQNCLSAIYLDGGPYVGCSDKQSTYGTMVANATKLQFFNN